MTPADLAAIHATCFTMPRPWSEAELAALLDSATTVACLDPHGFALGRVVLDEAELLTIAVLPAARRQGLGARLLAAFEAALVARGVARAFLEVAADNTAARALYRKAGWQDCALRRGYYRDAQGTPVDAVVMERTFAQPKA